MHKNKKDQGQFPHERGASAIEYALLLACLVLVLVTAFTSFGDQIKTSLEGSLKKIQTTLGSGQ